MTFLIARPIEKAENTAAFFQQHKLTAQALPILSIELATNLDYIERLKAAKPVCIIVTSTYAAQWLLHAYSKVKLNLQFTQLSIVCVGQASALILADVAIESNVFIASPENSEGVLNAQCLADVRNKSVLILKGVGGRTLIADTLGQRNAHVTQLDVYKRVGNLPAIKALTFEPSPIKCIIATSIEITELLLANVNRPWLFSRVWIVASERIKDYAHKNGIPHILVSQGASNQALLSCAKQLVNTGVVSD